MVDDILMPDHFEVKRYKGTCRKPRKEWEGFLPEALHEKGARGRGIAAGGEDGGFVPFNTRFEAFNSIDLLQRI